MKWAPGKDTYGRVQTCDDGQPTYYISDCSKYTVSRALTERGPVFDSWKLAKDSRGRRANPLQLAGGCRTPKEAIKACEVDANGLLA